MKRFADQRPQAFALFLVLTLRSAHNQFHASSKLYFHTKTSTLNHPYNAYQEFEKLTDLKEECVQNSKRKKLEVDNSEEPILKQPKIGDVIAPPYVPEHPGQQALTNAIAQMICVDAMPVSTVSRKGFQDFVLIVAAKATYDTLSVGWSASDTLLWALLSSH